MKTFQDWRLAFRKAVAAASVRPEPAFLWISQVEKETSWEALADSKGFPELDTLLATEWDRIMQGEFLKNIRIKEAQLSKEGKMIKGRQITWLVYDNFRLSNVDVALLGYDEIMRLELDMPADNIKKFLNDWDKTFTNIKTSPD